MEQLGGPQNIGGDAEFDEDAALVLLLQHRLTLLRLRRRRRGRKGPARRRGSVQGRMPNKKRNFALGVAMIRRDYFGVGGAPPIYDEVDFERRFRVPRTLFLRIYYDIKDLTWWAQRPNATGRLQAHPLQKLVAAFRVLGYEESPDRVDEYVRLSKSTVHEAVRRLVAFFLHKYQAVYLRAPTIEDLKRILARNAERGLPGCRAGAGDGGSSAGYNGGGGRGGADDGAGDMSNGGDGDGGSSAGYNGEIGRAHV